MKIALALSTCLMVVSTAHAAYIPKGSWVGRLFSEPVSEAAKQKLESGARDAVEARGDTSAAGQAAAAGQPHFVRDAFDVERIERAAQAGASGSLGHRVASALRPYAMLTDGSSAKAEDTEETDEKPISPENLAALMKHPTVPHYDLLRPMSGVWARCSPSAGEPGVQSLQERFTSTDSTHFTRSTIRASDGACKNAVTEWRTTYACKEAGKGVLACTATKQETRAGQGAFTTDPTSKDQLKASNMKLSFVGIEKPKKRSKKSPTTPAVADKDRHLDIRVLPISGGEPQMYHLDFLPDAVVDAGPAAPVAPPRAKH